MNSCNPLAQRLWSALFGLLPLPRPTPGRETSRDEACRLCGSTRGIAIAEVEYWDLRRSRLVKCPNCGLTQFDPMLTEAETAAGCRAYHIQETLAESRHSRIRNCVRNFRRGIAFASRLKKRGINPRNILELGPGTGYFAAGMQFIFEEANVTVIDVVDEVLEDMRIRHGFDVVKGTPEKIDAAEFGPFDLVVARDLIEHVTDAGTLLRKIHGLLETGGHFHFITPNGYEDLWRFFARQELTGEPSEILINHVNYYDGAGLARFLEQVGFACVAHYTYTVKFTRRGRGWRLREKNAAPVSQGRSAERMILGNADRLDDVSIPEEEILREWWLRPGSRWLAPLYCRLRDLHIVRLSPHLNVGHEIFGLWRKK